MRSPGRTGDSIGPAGEPTLAPLEAFRRTTAWANRPSALAAALTRCTGVSLRCVGSRDPSSEHELGAVLGMVDIEHSLALWAGLYCSSATGRSLARAILGQGEPERETLHEVLAELCNATVGVLQSAFRREGFCFTMGLPQAGEVARGRELVSFPAASLTVLAAEDIELTVALLLRAAPAVTLASEDLQEDMVLVDDLRDGAGEIVAKGGTRLTAAAVQRISRVLPGQRARVFAFDELSPTRG